MRFADAHHSAQPSLLEPHHPSTPTDFCLVGELDSVWMWALLPSESPRLDYVLPPNYAQSILKDRHQNCWGQVNMGGVLSSIDVTSKLHNENTARAGNCTKKSRFMPHCECLRRSPGISLRDLQKFDGATSVSYMNATLPQLSGLPFEPRFGSLRQQRH